MRYSGCYVTFKYEYGFARLFQLRTNLRTTRHARLPGNTYYRACLSWIWTSHFAQRPLFFYTPILPIFRSPPLRLVFINGPPIRLPLFLSPCWTVIPFNCRRVYWCHTILSLFSVFCLIYILTVQFTCQYPRIQQGFKFPHQLQRNVTLVRKIVNSRSGACLETSLIDMHRADCCSSSALKSDPAAPPFLKAVDNLVEFSARVLAPSPSLSYHAIRNVIISCVTFTSCYNHTRIPFLL